MKGRTVLYRVNDGMVLSGTVVALPEDTDDDNVYRVALVDGTTDNVHRNNILAVMPREYTDHNTLGNFV